MKTPVYLDYHATTPVDPRVLDAMLPWFSEKFGNAASRSHRFGWEAERTVEEARRNIAGLIGASAKEIVFTSGATESNNLALKGAAEAYRSKGDHMIAAATEHKSVLDVLKRLEKSGITVTLLPVGSDGLIEPQAVERALTDATTLVTIMYANNEIGVIHPIAEIGRICRERGVLFHCDAVQAAGKIPVDVIRDNIDLMSLSAHKLYGPKGIGALYVRRRVQIASQIDGGGHERGMRSGTLNVPAIVGFGEACAISQREMADEAMRLQSLRDHLKQRLESALDAVHVNGSMEHRLPNNLNMSFEYVDSESLLMSLNDVALSSGSACTSATLAPSHVLKALGLGQDLAHSSIRFGLGRFNTAEEIDYAADRVIQAVRKLRELSPLYEMALRS
jgi:cysteine desulfurase